MRFENKIVVLTGATRSIGRAAATEFVKEGASLVLSARSTDELERTRAELSAEAGRVLAIPGDICNVNYGAALVEQSLEHFGRIDALVNNVGGGSPIRDVDQIPDAEWNRDMETNLNSVYRLCRSVVPVMKQKGYGRIVMVSSIAGRSHGHLSGTCRLNSSPRRSDSRSAWGAARRGDQSRE